MMKQHKIKLVLNSQTIRRMQVSELKDVNGGIAKNQSVEVCPSDNCSAHCRACG